MVAGEVDRPVRSYHLLATATIEFPTKEIKEMTTKALQQNEGVWTKTKREKRKKEEETTTATRRNLRHHLQHSQSYILFFLRVHFGFDSADGTLYHRRHKHRRHQNLPVQDSTTKEKLLKQPR